MLKNKYFIYAVFLIALASVVFFGRTKTFEQAFDVSLISGSTVLEMYMPQSDRDFDAVARTGNAQDVAKALEFLQTYKYKPNMWAALNLTSNDKTQHYVLNFVDIEENKMLISVIIKGDKKAVISHKDDAKFGTRTNYNITGKKLDIASLMAIYDNLETAEGKHD